MDGIHYVALCNATDQYESTVNDTCDRRTTNIVLEKFLDWVRNQSWESDYRVYDSKGTNNFAFGVYNSGSYPTVQDAIKCGGLYEGGHVLYGVTALRDAVDVFKTTAQCADGNSDLLFVFREVP